MHILTTVGSGDFDDLVQTMDRLTPQLIAAGDSVQLQIGEGRYVPQHATWFRFAPSLEPHIAQADLVVAHGGLGVTIEVLRQGKRLVSVSNPDRYDAHQGDLLSVLSRRGHLIWCQDLAHLAEAIDQARTASFVPYQEELGTLAERIVEYILGVGSREYGVGSTE
jgi:UDP-N-acetylglucosamine transferase subunit ALG13